MRRGRSFVKKTRKGKVVKVVKEHYLRDDIWCASSLCHECGMKSGEAKLPSNESTFLYTSPDMSDDDAPSVQYIIVDTNVALHQTDVLEHAAIENVIFLQTGML